MNQERDLVLLDRIRSACDMVAKDELVQKYLPMVRHIVKNHNSYAFDFDDYYQEGAIGLLKAIEEYDPVNFNIKFSTFAYICITRRILNTIRRSRSKKQLIVVSAISLDQGSEDFKNRTLIDLINNNSEEPFNQIEKEWTNQTLDSVLKVHLSPVEYQVIKKILAGDHLNEIQLALGLPAKVIDNARTRARIKLRKIVKTYGSLLNPNIPLKARKRKDLTLRLEVS